MSSESNRLIVNNTYLSANLGSLGPQRNFPEPFLSMRVLCFIALLCFCLSVSGQDSQCKSFKTPDDCAAGTQNGTSCVWCLCKAVPSSCHTCVSQKCLISIHDVGHGSQASPRCISMPVQRELHRVILIFSEHRINVISQFLLCRLHLFRVLISLFHQQRLESIQSLSKSDKRWQVDHIPIFAPQRTTTMFWPPNLSLASSCKCQYFHNLIETETL